MKQFNRLFLISSHFIEDMTSLFERYNARNRTDRPLRVIRDSFNFSFNPFKPTDLVIFSGGSDVSPYTHLRYCLTMGLL